MQQTLPFIQSHIESDEQTITKVAPTGLSMPDK
jgi:hypothetical protein